MVKFTKEYLSLLQCLLYKAQKRQQRKQILKFQKIFYKSKSIFFIIVRYRTLKNSRQKKIKTYLSKSVFENFLKFCILKKQIQVLYFLSPKLKSKNKIKNFVEHYHNISSYTLFLDAKRKEIFFINLVSDYTNLQLSYLSLKHFQVQFLFAYSLFSFFLTSVFVLGINKKKTYVLSKNYFLKLGMKSLGFHYKTYYDFYFYHHNFFRDTAKIEYQNIFYFTKKKHQFFINKKQKNQNIKIKKKRQFDNNNNFNNNKNHILKNNRFCYYSTIFNYPYFRQNVCFFSSKLLNNIFFYYLTNIRFFEIELNSIQKQFLLFVFEPIWEASFECSSYSNRLGRSLYDAIEYIRINLRKQPMFLFKIYFKFLCTNIEKKEGIFNKLSVVDNNIKIDSLFSSFFENLFFYGIQKKYQNNYLKTKQQLFLYEIFKIFKQNNNKRDISFYKIFYNKYFCFLTIQNKIQLNAGFINNDSVKVFEIYKNSVKNYKNFVIDYNKNISFINFKNKINSLRSINYKLENYLTNNFMIFSLNNFFFEKINNLKQRLFLIELYKNKFPFYLQKFGLNFFPFNNNLSKIKVISFSTLLKDSNLFVSKNAFLCFFIKKHKKAFFETNLLNYWTKKDFCFFTKTQPRPINKFKYIINPIKYFFVFSNKIKPALCNYETFLKLNLSFFFRCFNSFNSFLNVASFPNFFLMYLLFIQNIPFYSNWLNKNWLNKKFFFMMYYCNFYGKFFSFIRYKLQQSFIIFLLEKNNVKLIWKFFMKYENQVIFFNANYIFLKSFQTILKKWIILNNVLLFLYIQNNKKLSSLSCFYAQFNSKSFLSQFQYNYNDWVMFYLKYYLNRNLLKTVYLNNILNKRFYLNKKKEKNFQKDYRINSLWSIPFFVIKEKHSFLLYNKKFNGFYFFNFFLFHTKKNHKNFFFNSLFFWQFYFIKILKKFKYIKYFREFYKIYYFFILKEKRWIKKKIKQRKNFYFFQSLFFKFHSKYTNYLENFIICSLKNKKIFSSFSLFNIIFGKIGKEESKIIFYTKLIQQKRLKIYYSFSIKPSKSTIKSHLSLIHTFVKKSHNRDQKFIIFKLSKIIKNWCFYYQIITPTIFYKYIDYLTLQMLWRWACKRHFQKSKKWIKMKYFYTFNVTAGVSKKTVLDKKYNNKTVFASKINFFINLNIKNNKNVFKNDNKIFKNIFICLPNHTDIILIKHKLIQNDRSPFDSSFFYWIPRNYYYSIKRLV